MKLKTRILNLMGKADYIPLDTAHLIDALGLKKKDRRDLNFEITRLLGKGDIVRIKRDCYCIPQDADLITGKIMFRQTGSAILIAEETSEHEKILIAAEDTGIAMHGDHVVVRLYSHQEIRQQKRSNFRKKPFPGRKSDEPSGKVIRILERARTTLTGSLQKSKLFYFVIPDDPRIINDIYVQDPAKSKLKPRPSIGDKVIVKLHDWTQRHINPEGRIIERLGRTYEPRAELKAIFHKFKLETEFPQSVLDEATAIGTTVKAKDRENRLDLRSIPTFTIDPDDAKDFDDALSVEVLDKKEYRIGIHIADVSAYVQPDSALDKEAHKRGNSTYLVGTVIPMLPKVLSNGLCSLKEGEDRLTKTVLLTFSKDKKIINVEFANSVIRSSKRLTYHQAYAFLKEDDIEKIKDLPLPPAHQTGSTGRALKTLSNRELNDLKKWVRALWTFASKLRQDRLQKGSLDLDMPETKIFVDKEGYADRLERIEQDESHQLIEEFMLIANEIVAKELKNARMPCVYRVHDKPDDQKLQELREFLHTSGVKVGDLSNRKEVVRLLKIIKTHPQGHLLKIQFLRSLKRACYRSTPDGHYGLHKQNYTHFTSPIRRYSDLITHRVFATFLTKVHNHPPVVGTSLNYKAARIRSLGEHLSLTEQNSTEAERESVKIKLLEFFERELQKPQKTKFPAIITDVRNHGFFIELVESMAFGMVHVSTLKGDLYRFDHATNSLIGRRSRKSYGVGKKIIVVTERVDRFKRQIDFRIVN
ncbi:MAG: RNB domain-containing ribonuclease [Opitutaceae bacterium]|nr:RNB domain-containing ribonuclease [Opitutaceae bacterium]